MQAEACATIAPRVQAEKNIKTLRSFIPLVPLLLLLGIAALVVVGYTRWPTGSASGIDALGSSPTTQPTTQFVYRIATFNMHSGYGEDDVYNLNRTIASVKDAEFCVLNEVRGKLFGQPANQAEELGQATAHRWLYLPSERRLWHDDFGNGLITRLPIIHWVRCPLPTEPQHGGYRNATIVEVLFGNRPVQILCTHIDRSRDQPTQLKMILRLFDSLKSPSILAGDLNADADHPDIQALLALPGVHDCLEEGTHKGKGRIDWILSRGLVTVAAGQIANGASDHPLYWADLKIDATTPDP